VDTYTLNFDGSYRVSETLYDSLLRAREIQTQTPDNGRTITDTAYNTDGLQSETTDPYYNSSPVDAALVQAQPGDVPSATGIAYDADGRKTSETAYALGNATWTTTYSYGGNSTTTVPPAGGTATTTITDARGHITDRYTYHAGVPADPVHDHAGDYDDTHYSWHPDGNQATVVDAAGNTWSYQYNLLGQQVSASDPDTGTSTNTYDNAGQLLTSTDARGAQTTTTYDADGRKTAKYDTTGGKATGPSDQIAAWTYDTLKKGYPTATTSYSGGDTYTQTVLAYNAMGTPQAKRTTLTGEGGTLIPAGGLVTTFGYSTTGYPTGENDAAAGGLPSENVQIGYDTFGQPTSLAGTIPTTSGVPSWTYVQAVGYSEFGKPLQYTMPAAGGNVWVTMAYDDQTHALTDVQTTDTKASTVVDDMTYRYSANGVSKGAGLITSTVDSQNGGAAVDAQCYSYDYATRLAGAWTATDNCAGGPSGSTVGGPDPYWQSWTYDAAGDRSGQVDHDVTGNAVNDTTTTYTYPTAAQQHTLSNTTATGPNAGTSSYAYDAAGNTTSITGGPTGNQTLTWNDQGKLATDATGAGTSSYVYDADGNLVVRRDPGQTTLFVGDEQLALNTAANTVSGTRYYTIGGATVAVRTSTGKNPQVLVPDHQGTDLLAIDTGTYGVTRRQFLPFGGTRGSAPSSWPGDKGYIGGTPDSTTQLENIGAREYDPATGRFLSPDPVLASDSPNQLGGYDYAGNDPVTGSDPTGMLMNCGPDGVLCGIRQQGQSDDEYQQERSYWQQYYKAHPPNPTPSYDSSSWTCGNNYGTGERTCSGINGGVAAASAPQAAADQIAQKVADAAKKMRTGETPEIRSDAAKVLNALRNNPGMKMISRAGKQEWVGDAGRVLLVVGAGYSFVSGYASAHDAGRTDDEALKIGATDAAVNTLAGWGGAEGGAWAGAAIGSAIAPGIGTLIGAGVGALVGSGLASWFSGYMDDFILDNNL
jgi:RHS repeat-associated protein